MLHFVAFGLALFVVAFVGCLLCEWLLPEPKVQEEWFTRVQPNYRHSDGTVNVFPEYHGIGDCSECGECD